MNIEMIRLNNFRNYEQQEIVLHPGTNLFYGDNAQGKTNILEAVFFCGTTKSHRGGRDREMIRFGQDEAHLRMILRRKDVPYRIDMHLKEDRAKGIAINGIPIKKASELVGLGNYVFFSPEDLHIIKNGPAERRRFLDLELCQLSGIYVHELSLYNRALLQRNRLLKDFFQHPEYEPMLDVWDEKLVESGKKIIRMRRDFVQELDDVMGKIHFRLSGEKEEMKVSYDCSVDEEQFAGRLRENRDRDIRLKMTHAGPHRDDLLFQTKEIDVRKFGSQGQQRTTALSLKLSEISLVRQRTGEAPVLLLDDVLSELDKNRQSFLLDSIDQIQTLITCTGVEEYRMNDFRIDRLFYVKEGCAREEMNG